MDTLLFIGAVAFQLTVLFLVFRDEAKTAPTPKQHDLPSAMYRGERANY